VDVREDRVTRAALTFLSDQPRVSADRLALVGVSLGGPNAIAAASRDERVPDESRHLFEQAGSPRRMEVLALGRISCSRPINDVVQGVPEIDRPTPLALDTPFARKLIQNRGAARYRPLRLGHGG
jgi:hypothetical protein